MNNIPNKLYNLHSLGYMAYRKSHNIKDYILDNNLPVCMKYKYRSYYC